MPNWQSQTAQKCDEWMISTRNEPHKARKTFLPFVADTSYHIQLFNNFAALSRCSK